MASPQAIAPVLRCRPLGAGQQDEGVCLWVEMGPHRFLLDAGLREPAPLWSLLDRVQAVFCSHAHGDHCRNLRAIADRFPELPLYASELTARLLDLPQLKPLPWGDPQPLAPDWTVTLFPAGHLPGAALFLFAHRQGDRTYRLIYTGDFNLSHGQLVEGLALERLRGIAPEVLILEGSYGTQRHPHRRHQEKQFLEQCWQRIQAGYNLLLPVPALGLGQEILKMLRSHHRFTGRPLVLWVDGGVVRGCDRYLTHLDHFPAAVQNFARHQALFWDDRIWPQMQRYHGQLTETETPVILVTDCPDLAAYPPQGDRPWCVLWAEGDEAWAIPEAWAQEPYLLTDHCDGRNTLQLIQHLKPQHLVFVHGQRDRLMSLTNLEELQSRYQLHTPAIGALVELPIGEKFVTPPPPVPARYEGEVNDQGAWVTLTLPESLTQDRRWQRFADTGLIEAQWQGESLIIRGLSPAELGTLPPPEEEGERCDRCIFFDDPAQRCRNPASPLGGFRVRGDGYCDRFAPRN